jgi:hypothetical protein
MKKEKPAAVKKIKKDYAKPLLTRHKKLTLITGGIDASVRLGCMRL